MPAIWDEKSVFLRALGMSPPELDAYLARACPDSKSRSRIEALLSHHAAGRDPLLRTPHASGAVAPGGSGAPGAVSPRQIGEFDIEREIGRGGMGVVYLARDRLLGRAVALKVLAPHLVESEQAIERLRQEARAVASLTHPGIVPIYRAGESDGRHFIAMEFVPGETLFARLRAAHPSGSDTPTGDLPAIFRDISQVRDAARIIAEVAEALHDAHRAGVIHRDLKPSNVIIEPSGRPRLTDFGIARIEGARSLTTTGHRAGTLPYMSPEQTEEGAAPVDHRSDLFSLGVVLYEMLSLRRPFDAPSQARLAESIRSHEPLELRQANRLVPPDLSTICQKAMEKKPQDRYQSAAELAADLRAFLAGEPIRARPPSAWRRARRWAQRHRRGVGLAGTSLAVIVAGSAAATAILAHRRQLCTLDLRADGSGLHAWIHPVDADGAPVGETIDLGSLPSRVELPTGVYRLQVQDGAGASLDTTVPLILPGATRTLQFAAALPIPDLDDMVFVPGGEYLCGEEEQSGLRAPRVVAVAPFYIDRTEVSNAEFIAFASATGAPLPPHFEQIGWDHLPMDAPVVGVTWDEAEAYARWLGKRLPTAVEWEAAMRRPDDRLRPWGDDPVDLPEVTVEDLQATRDGSGARRLYMKFAVPVDSRPDLSTPEGILHAASNAHELTASFFAEPTVQVVYKGASWLDDPGVFHLSRFGTLPAESPETPTRTAPARSMRVGFRCVRSAAP